MNNTDSIEVTAATVEQAIREAVEQLGAAEDDVVIEVLATARAGVLGLGARPARVRVSRRPPVTARSGVSAPPPAPPLRREVPAPATRREAPAVRSQPEMPAVRRPSEIPAAPRQAETPAAQTRGGEAPAESRPREQRSGEQRGPREPRQRPPRPERSQPQGRADQRPERRPERKPPPPPEAFAETAPPEPRAGEFPAAAAPPEGGGAPRIPANMDDQVREATAVLTQLLQLMNEKAEVLRIEGDPESVELEIKGDGSGILIGRHGQTLDALEYLLNRIVARKFEDAVPILIDTESYRARRRQQLHRMALSMSERAKREHAPVKLDPMPPRDRRIIHLALKDDPMVSTRSEGDGFLRSVEIIPAEGRRERTGGGGGGPREREPDKGRSPHPGVGEQGGFKHGQKRLF